MLQTDDPTHIINKTDSLGHTPLYTASKNGNLDVVILLIENKANPFLYSTVNEEILS
jgi:Ankyrin repeat.